MSQDIASNGGESGLSAKTHAAAQETSAVTTSAAEAAHSVVETGKQEASAVAGEAKARLGDLVSQSGRELSDQAATQQKRLAEGLSTVSDDLSRMADADENGGLAGELVRRVAGHVSTVGSWLGDRDPQQLLHEATSFARRRPGTFIAVAAIAGVVVGRLSRAIAAGAASGSGSSPQSFRAPEPIDVNVDVPPPPPVPVAVVEVEETEVITDVDDAPLYSESAARADGFREGGSHDRPDTL